MRYLRGLLLFTMAVSSAVPALADDAQKVIVRSFEAMGGRQRLEAIASIEYSAVGERSMVEQSERPSGPYFIDHFRLHEVRDLARARLRMDSTDEAYAADQWWLQQPAQTPTTVVINDDVAVTETPKGPQFAGGYYVQANQEQFAFAPERLLATAASATDLREDTDVVLHGMPHHVLAFTWNGTPCRLFVNAGTNLPWQIQFTRPYPYQTFLNAWGDVATTITYNAWALEPNGVVYPREWTYERVGLPDMRLAIVQLKFNVGIDDAALTVPKDVYDAHHGKLRAVNDVPLGYGGSGAPHELAPGITEYPGGWNVAFVRQRDGIVVIEAPWSTGYTQRAFDEASKRYQLPIKAVITTSDSWPHIAGVRQAVADGIPVYALDLNGPILKRLITAPHTMRPDALQQNPRAPHFIFVSKPLTVGDGDNRLTIIPYRTATAERQMMVYFPSHHLLYTSDLFAPDGNGGWFTPEYLHEAIGAIQREHLAPATIFGMHYDATPYQTIVDALRTFVSSGT